MTSTANDDAPKAATAARIYDYFLGGTHNFPADREAAQALLQVAPVAADVARANRAFLRRAVRFLVDSGIRQFLDIGSGIPTAGNVHEVAQVLPDARVVYVDIDPVAVAESLEILEGNEGATAIRGDLRDPDSILNHPDVQRLIDFNEPVGVLIVSVLHFVPDDSEAYGAVDRLLAATPSGSYLVASHGTIIGDLFDRGDVEAVEGVYKGRTSTAVQTRDRAGVERFFAGLEMVEPGLVWLPLWRPVPGEANVFADDPSGCPVLAGVGRRA